MENKDRRQGRDKQMRMSISLKKHAEVKYYEKITWIPHSSCTIVVRTQSLPPQADTDRGSSKSGRDLREALWLDKYQLETSSSKRLKLDMMQLARIWWPISSLRWEGWHENCFFITLVEKKIDLQRRTEDKNTEVYCFTMANYNRCEKKVAQI